MPRIFKALCGLGLVLTTVLILVLTSEPSSLVLWGNQRALVLESDDWGLAGFIPHGDIWVGRHKEDIVPGHFPEVYWGTTLEDSAMVAGVCQIMSSFLDQDGLSGVFQPNYVLSSLSFEKSSNGEVWSRYDLPEFPPTYPRPRMWEAVESGIAQGTWYPEFHAAWHYDPQQRLERALSTEFSRKLTLEGVTLFPGIEAARELGPQRSWTDLELELSHALGIFEKVFGRSADSVIAPDYTWSDPMERIWLNCGLTMIQAKREQRDPSLPSGILGRVFKFLGRKLAYLKNRDRVYLERNCRLEPVQDPNPETIVERCYLDLLKAWHAGQPGIVETHRVNFAHTDGTVLETGQEALYHFLEKIQMNGELPSFMTDREVAHLTTRGVSVVDRGGFLVLRNGTHARRLLSFNMDSKAQFIMLDPDQVLVIPSH